MFNQEMNGRSIYFFSPRVLLLMSMFLWWIPSKNWYKLAVSQILAISNSVESLGKSSVVLGRRFFFHIFEIRPTIWGQKAKINFSPYKKKTYSWIPFMLMSRRVLSSNSGIAWSRKNSKSFISFYWYNSLNFSSAEANKVKGLLRFAYFVLSI